MTPDPGGEVDDLTLGRLPRPPLARRTKGVLAAVAAAVVAAVVVALVLPRPAGRVDAVPSAAGAPVASPTGFAAGPVLVAGDDGDQLTVPGGAMFGGAAMNVALTPDDAAVAAVRTTLPSFADVRGGRVTDPAIHYGIYLQGTYTAPDGTAVTLALYSALAPGTPASTDVTVRHVAVDGRDGIRTEASVYTGTGWWLHGVALAAATPLAVDQRQVLTTLLADPPARGVSTRHEASDDVVLVEVVDGAPGTGAEPDDGLALGRPPRPPMKRRTRRVLSAGLAVVAVAGVVAVGLTRPAGDSAPPAGSASPVVESSAGFAAGPLLVSVDGKDALQPPGLPGLGASVRPVVLDPAPTVVAVVAAALPGFHGVRGGRIPNGGAAAFGVYLAGSYTGNGGAAVTVTLYTVRAPGTTFGSDQYVSRTRFDREYTTRTDVSVFTGTGWWVHIVSLGPDDPATAATGEIARLLPLAENPGLVST